MALNYRSVDRDQSFLLPPDMCDWLPKDHLVWFILEVITQLDTAVLRAESKLGGTGREGYDPAMLLGLWVYASARGIHSSRQIERACWEDIAFRVLCAQDVPDHTVLARFRQRHQDAMGELFTQVLAVCVSNGLGRLGVIAIDGTKIKANASKDKTVALKRLRQLAAAELDRAAAVDAAEDAAGAPAAGDDLPPGMGPGADRAGRIRAAIEDLERVVEAENAPRIKKFEARLEQARRLLAEREAEVAASRAGHEAGAGKRLRGSAAGTESKRSRRRRDGVTHAQRLLDRALAQAAEQSSGGAGKAGRAKLLLQRNVTDPQSRIMRTRSGFIQGYNAQLAVADDQLILVAQVTDQGNDRRQAIPVMEKVRAAVDHCQAVTDRTDLQVGTVVFDNGYLSEENVASAGYDRLIAPGRGRVENGPGEAKVTDSAGSNISRATQLMITKLGQDGNRDIYRRRSVLVEPVNGHLKDRRGLRQFSRRGLAAVNAELQLAALTTNLMKLFTTTWQPAKACS